MPDQHVISERLLENIQKHIHVPVDVVLDFAALFKIKSLKKKQFLLQAGEVCKFEGFVNKGLFKVFHTNSDGIEQVLYFAIEGWWVTDIDSFTNQKPARLSIQALEDSEVFLIEKHEKENAYKQIPYVERLYRIMTQKTHVALQQRLINSLSRTADQNYVDFITRYPDIAKRLTNYQIASYLGISHEFLSKIRKKISRQK